MITQHLIQQINSLRNIFDRRNIGQRRALDQTDLKSQFARRRQFAIRSRAAAILGQDQINIMGAQQRDFIFQRKWSAPQNIFGVRQIGPRRHRLNGADQIIVLRGTAQGLQFLAPESCENSPGRADVAAVAFNDFKRCAQIGDLTPTITRLRPPGGPPDRQQRSPGFPGGLRRISRNRRGERMGGVNQQINLAIAQKARQTIHAAKTACAHFDQLCNRRSRAPGQRHGAIEIRTLSDLRSETAGLRRAAKNEKFVNHAAQ